MAAINSEPSIDNKQSGKIGTRRWLNSAVVLLILLFFFLVINFDIFNIHPGSFSSLPISIRAGSEADYSQDPHTYSIPPISENILNQIITAFPATGNPQDRISTLQAVLLTPVPVNTLAHPLTATPTPTLPPPTPGLIAIPPNPTAFSTPTPTPTLYFSPTPTATYIYLTFTPTPTPTATYIYPTFTFTPTSTSRPPVPTATYARTSTPLPLPTSIPGKHKPTKPPKPKPTEHHGHD